MDHVSFAAIKRARSALDLIQPEERAPYSIAHILRAQLAGRWPQHRSHELDVHRELTEQYGESDDARDIRLPHDALVMRDMTAAGVCGSNFLVGTSAEPIGYIETLQPFSAALALGAQAIDPGRDNVAAPRGTAGATAVWLSDENSQITESQPTIGQTVATPNVLAALCDVGLVQCEVKEIFGGLIREYRAVRA